MHIHDELVIEADPRMSTFIKKIKNHPLKSGVHLQWELEVDAFSISTPERRTPN
jgi:pentose-5-phosphate-3-epimerase